MGQEPRGGLAGCFWLSVSHEVSIEVSSRGLTGGSKMPHRHGCPHGTSAPLWPLAGVLGSSPHGLSIGCLSEPRENERARRRLHFSLCLISKVPHPSSTISICEKWVTECSPHSRRGNQAPLFEDRSIEASVGTYFKTLTLLYNLFSIQKPEWSFMSILHPMASHLTQTAAKSLQRPSGSYVLWCPCNLSDLTSYPSPHYSLHSSPSSLLAVPATCLGLCTCFSSTWNADTPRYPNGSLSYFP